MTNVVTKKSIMSKLVNGQVNPSDLVSVASLDRFLVLKPSDKMKRLQCCLDSDGYVIIADAECNYKYYLNLILFKKPRKSLIYFKQPASKKRICLALLLQMIF